ncbi:polyhydroxyalkanoic acid system family protein [Beijerinckia indica]|uniref:Polyhydroxyalkanoic acid system protein n=1 Tax=Beijerinckia indica subsp. indica (strain ATCC 9039 / DSM 1715 / NCIMB 8712) TaxID=395963 RepID=B2IEW1_BEII9|nr:polyhydroxyalkanoic acid system family protein [Beijerinckia indica]ACB94152.1 conserved hypothetical protein [Beijerinckia indica subsp. indica ATCC 9039]
MSKSIIVTLPHALSAEEAKKRIAERIDVLRTAYIDKLAYSEAVWTENRADLRVVAFGQTATAQVHVLQEIIRLEVQLPWILATLSGKIQNVLTQNAQESLQIGYSPKKG